MKLLFVGGTDSYMAPEVLLAEEYGPAADIFSLGLVMVSLLSLKPIGEPYSGDIKQPVYMDISEGDELEEEGEEEGASCGREGEEYEDDQEGHEEVTTFEDHHDVLEPHLMPLQPILERHPRYFFEANVDEIRSNALSDAPAAFIDVAIQVF
jgi:serine/threonine protein kinase